MRIFGSARDSKLKSIASISCAVLGTLLLLRAMYSGHFDYLNVVNIFVFLLLGAAFAIASAWLDKRPVLESTPDVLVVRKGLFRRRLHRSAIKSVSLVENSVKFNLHSKSKPIVIKSLSVPVSECFDLVQRWQKDPSV